MLAASTEYNGPEMKRCVNKVGWLHQSTSTVFVVCLNVANQIKVVTVLRLPGKSKPIQWREVMSGKGKQAPGIKVRTTKRKPVLTKLYDETGEWLANVRWRPCGTMAFELAPHVKKAVVGDR